MSPRDYAICIALTILGLLFASVMIYLDTCAHARNYCPPPPEAELVQMRGTGYCPRVPTPQLPYCPQ